jgi:hypothetical protein
MKWVILLGVFLVLFCLDVGALGISPSKINYDFEPGLSDEITFRVINSESVPFNVEVYVEGDLAEYFDFERTPVTLPPGEAREFTVFFNFPSDLRIAPGEHRTDIVAAQVGDGEEGGTVAAFVAVAIPVLVEVPYEGIFLDAKIEIGEAEAGTPVDFGIELISLGKEVISIVNGNIGIINEEGVVVDEIIFQELNIQPLDTRLVSLEWFPGDNSAGIYNATLFIEYDGEEANFVKEFRLGDLLIDILDLEEKKFKKGQINRINVLTRSFWNYEINDAYAEIFIFGSSSKSESMTFGSWEEKTVPVYFDMNGLESGEYEARVVLSYEGVTTEKVFDITIGAILFSVTNLIYAGLVVVLIVLVVLFLKKRKLFKSKKARLGHGKNKG